jgi:hypothetical protein
MSVVPSGDLIPQGSIMRDDNDSPVYYPGLTKSDVQILTGNNTTVAVPIFTVTGQIEVTALYGVVTTTLGNNTAAYFRTNDGTTQNNITLNTGVTMTGSVIGSILAKTSTASAALTIQSASSAKIGENGAGLSNFQDFRFEANPLATSNIEFVYTTTDTPTTGAITFYIRWLPLTAGSTITSL